MLAGSQADEGGESQLRLLSLSENGALLTDWLSRSRIYGMSDDPMVRWREQSGRAAVESMMWWGLQEEQQEASHVDNGLRAMAFGLWCTARDDAKALAAAEASWDSGLVVKHLAVEPSEAIKGPASTALDHMLEGLEQLADKLGFGPPTVHLPKYNPVRSSSSGIVYFGGIDDLEQLG